jgi:hypothetical protein
MLEGTQVNPELCPSACYKSCAGGEAAYASQFDEIKKVLPPSRILLGSDIDAPLTFLKPSCSALQARYPLGYWNYAQLPELFQFLRERALLAAPPAGAEESETYEESMTEVFLRAWERVL